MKKFEITRHECEFMGKVRVNLIEVKGIFCVWYVETQTTLHETTNLT